MGRTAETYQKLLQSLLPKGRAWNRLSDSVLGEVLLAEADEMVRVEERGFDLFTESFIRTTDELLEDHELDYGIPEFGESLGETTQERIDVLLAQPITGQQNSAYFVEIASYLNYTVTISEFTPCWSGVAVSGDACGDQNNIFFWLVNIEVVDGMDLNLTRIINKLTSIKPAHTHILFGFTGIEFGRGFDQSFSAVPYYDGTVPLGDCNYEFSLAFSNNYSYDGRFLTGGFSPAFSIAFDSHPGGDFSDSFTRSEYSTLK